MCVEVFNRWEGHDNNANQLIKGTCVWDGNYGISINPEIGCDTSNWKW